MVCDKCGKDIDHVEVLASVDAVKGARWDMERKARATRSKSGVMVEERFRRRTKHICVPCADLP
jgi:hypothetical protein